jgi:hypothetical protein
LLPQAVADPSPVDPSPADPSPAALVVKASAAS